MDRKTVFTKTTKGLMEATGKTSRLSRDLRNVLKEVDGKATVDGLQTRLSKLSEDKLEESLQTLLKDDYVREFATAGSSVTPTAARTAPPPPPRPSSADGEEDLDFTAAIPATPKVDTKAEEAARQKAQAAAAAAAATRAKAAAEAAAKAKAEAEAKARALAAARAKAEAEAKAKAEAAARAKAEAEAKAKAEAEAKAKAEAEARAKREAEERARKEAEEKAKREADELRAKLEEERKAREEAERQRKESEEKARREADELRAKLEEERKAREESERKAKEEAERKEREEAERKAKEEAERKAKEEAERKEREETERKAKEEAERKAKEEAERKEREETERKAKEEAERKAKEEAERKEREETERKAKEEAERKAKEEAERKEREETERKAKEEAERKAKEEAERKEREETERKAKEEAERKAKEEAEARARAETGEAERKAKEEAERKEKEEAARKAKEETERKEREDAERKAKEESERKAREEAERKEKDEAERKAKEDKERKDREEAERRRKEDEEKSAREAAEKAEATAKSGPSLEDLVKIETDFDAVSAPPAEMKPEPVKAKESDDDRMLREFEAKAAREAEEKERLAAEEQARRKSEEEAKRAEDERGRRDEKEQPSKRAAAGGAPEKDLDYAEAQALQKAQEEETERHFAEMEKELEAEGVAGKARKETVERPEPARRSEAEDAGERIRAAAAARAAEARVEEIPAPPVYRKQVKWGKPVALVLFLVLVLGLVSVHFVSFDGSIPRFEKAAGAYLQQPVKIKALHLSLVPTPHWSLDGVTVGSEGELKVEKVRASAGLGGMFGDKLAFSEIELESPVLGERGMTGLLFGKPGGEDFRVANIVVKGGKLESKTFILPALDAKIAMAENGTWQKITLRTPDQKTSLVLTPDGDGMQVEVDTNVFSLPFDASFFLEDFSAKGVMRRGELKLSELKGGIYGGFLTGSAILKWNGEWTMTGNVSVRAMDPGRFAPALFEEGALEGKAAYAMRGKSYDELFAAPRLEGNFEIRKGALLGVDLARLLQGGGTGGRTLYAELTGTFLREAGRTQLRQINLVSGPLSAGGTVDADAAKRLGGRFVVELKSPVAQARSNLTLTGTLKEPRFSR